MLRLVRSLCLVCFCFLAAAVVIAIAETVALSFATNVAGCRLSGEIVPNFTCREGLLQRPIELILNVPILLVIAPVITLFEPATPNPAFMMLLYVFDAIVVLALAHPVLALLARRRARS